MSGEVRDQIAAWTVAHDIAAFSGDSVACSCDHTWRTNAAHRYHLTEALAPLVEAVAVQRAADELEAAVEELRDHQAKAVVKASALLDAPITSITYDREVGRGAGYGAAAQRVAGRAAALRATAVQR